jgi:RNA-directed DNA polymerase
VAKSQPERRLNLLYDKVCRLDILEEAWRRVKSNGRAAGVDCVSIDEVQEYGVEQFLHEIHKELQAETYRINQV